MGRVMNLANAKKVAKIFWATLLVYRPIIRGPRHKVSTDLVVSLTSYPPRFRTLHRTLRCLLNQSVSPDHLILWIAHDDMMLLPASVRALEGYGLEIRATDDWRSLKKIGPALLAFPNAAIVTADDDLFYPRHWLKNLVAETNYAIVTYRALDPRWEGDHYASLRYWSGRTKKGLLASMSGSGTLFPPGALHPDVTNFELFAQLAPTCDDIWMAWHAARNGTETFNIADPTNVIAWENTIENSLSVENHGAFYEGGVHDALVKRMVAHYGPLHQLKDLK